MAGFFYYFKTNFIATLQENNNKNHFTPRHVRTDNLITAVIGSEHNSSKTATWSDDAICCNSRHGTAKSGSSTNN